MLLTVYLLFIGLHVSEGCTLVNSEQQLQHKQPLPITAHTGGSVLLLCSCTDLQTKPKQFRWKRANGNTWVEMAINSDQYRNRVQLVNDHSPGNLSLLISHLTEEDGGVYQCAVKGSHISIRLTVKVCTLENRGQLLTITAHTGGSVLLPCSCTDLQTKPEKFSWTKHIRNTQRWEEMSSGSGQYRNRVQLVNDHSPGNLSLLISHLTEEDGGDYQCAVKDSYTFIRLTIEEGPATPSTASSPTTSSPTTSSPTTSSSTASSSTASSPTTSSPTASSPTTSSPTTSSPTTSSPTASSPTASSTTTSSSTASSPTTSSSNASSPTASSPTASSPAVTNSQTKPGSSSASSAEMPDGGSAKAAASTAVVNGHTSPANALADTSQTPVSDNSSSKNLFIYILLLLLGLGGVGVLYWRCRGRRQAQAESQDQRRMKREQEAQDEVMYTTVVHSRTPAATLRNTIVGEKTEYATIKINE